MEIGTSTSEYTKQLVYKAQRAETKGEKGILSSGQEDPPIITKLRK